MNFLEIVHRRKMKATRWSATRSNTEHGDAECPRPGEGSRLWIGESSRGSKVHGSKERKVLGEFTLGHRASSKTTFSRPKADNDPRRGRRERGKGMDSLTTRLHLIAVVVAIATIIANENRLYTSAVVAPEHVVPAAIACNRKHREHEGIGRLQRYRCRDR